MKKHLINTLKILGYTVLVLGFILGYSVKGIIKAPVWGKSAIILAYSGVVTAFIFKRPVFWVLLGIIGVVSIVFATYIIKETVETEKDWSHGASQENRKKIPFFEGLEKEAAKEEYRRLMKMYHPDNGRFGDLEKTQEIAIAYSQYVTRYGR